MILKNDIAEKADTLVESYSDSLESSLLNHDL